jgi:hypothetical protein
MKVSFSAQAMQIPEGGIPQAGEGVRGWQEVTSRISNLMQGASRAAATPAQQVKQLSEMIKLQMDVCRYQVRVELVSKISESGVASVRKLQQTQ